MNPQIKLLVLSFSALALLVGPVFGKPAATPKKKAAAPVTFTSACATQGQHGVDRWKPKTDASPVPGNKSAIQKVTPSDICKWKGPGPKVPLTKKTETRLPVEQKWYELTGRVADVRVEADGDIHVALADANGMRVGVEVPVGTRWCKIRQAVFSWTNAKFPFAIKSNKVFKVVHPHVIAVTGKAFYDVDHAPKDHSNRSTIHENTAAFEIHPVAALKVVQ
ncbi:MAG: hypothetical protein QOI07_2613 [Verrucomicrobiota bacterium]